MSNEMEEKTGQRKELSRRLFLKGVGSSAVAAPVLAGAEALKEVQGAGTKILGPGLIPIALTINGETYKIRAEPRETLLDVMRNRLEITGAKMI